MKLIILDANVILELFRLDLFNTVLGRYKIKIPTTIKNECIYYLDQGGNEIYIDWIPFIENKKIEEVSAQSSHFLELAEIFKEDFYRGIDPGELEAIAIINNSEDEDLFFCSGDLPSLKAMGVLGKSNQVLSLKKY